jgi:hypothetical protein
VESAAILRFACHRHLAVANQTNSLIELPIRVVQQAPSYFYSSRPADRQHFTVLETSKRVAIARQVELHDVVKIYDCISMNTQETIGIEPQAQVFQRHSAVIVLIFQMKAKQVPLALKPENILHLDEDNSVIEPDGHSFQPALSLVLLVGDRKPCGLGWMLHTSASSLRLQPGMHIQRIR